MSRNVIPDGYTRDGYIAAQERLHDELSFTYRPMFGGDPLVFTSQEFRLSPPKTQAKMEAASIKRHLISWTEVDEKGTPVPITEDNIFRLLHVVRQRLLNIIAGFSPSDVKLDATAKAPAMDANSLLEAIATGRPIGEVIAEGDEKN